MVLERKLIIIIQRNILKLSSSLPYYGSGLTESLTPSSVSWGLEFKSRTLFKFNRLKSGTYTNAHIFKHI